MLEIIQVLVKHGCLENYCVSVAQHSVNVELASGLVIHRHFDKELLTNRKCQEHTVLNLLIFH